ncbi:Leucine-rich repeat, partial [Trema orientale]
MASNFEPQNLVKLDMCSSKIKELWNGVKHLGNMKDIDLSFCEELSKLPDLSQAPKLENMNLRGCKNLHRLPNLSTSIKYLTLRRSGIETFPSSFGSLENLVNLDLRVCDRLKSLPKLPRNIKTLSLLTCRRLESLPSNIWKLKSLKMLNLYNCSRLKILPEISEVVEHVKSLYLDGTGIQELPSSIEKLTGLRYLDLNWCENLEFDPKSLCALSDLSRLSLGGLQLGCFPSMLLDFHSLTSLELGYCSIPEIPDWLGSLSSLTKIDLRGNNFERIPPCVRQLFNLKYLNVSRCKNLRHMLELQSSIENVEATECTSLETVDTASKVINELARPNWIEDEVGFLFFNCWNMDQSAQDNILINFVSQVRHISTAENDQRSSDSLTEFTTVRTCYPGNRIPKWFNNQCEGSTATINLTPNWLNKKFLGFATSVSLEFDDCFKFNYLDIDITIHFKANYGEEDKHCDFRVYFITDVVEPMEKESLIISSDHVFICYPHAPSKFNDINPDAVEASFDFSCHLHSGRRPESKMVPIKAKMCGIRMIYLQEAEEEGPSQEDSIITQDFCSAIVSCSKEIVPSGCPISELLEEPELIVTNHPEPSGTETICSDAEES